MAQQTIVAHFDSRADAQKAVDALAQAGAAGTSVRLLPEDGATSYERSSMTSAYDRERDEGGFWASLGDMSLPDEDRYAYAEGMSRGGATVSVKVDEDSADEAMDLLERHGAVDLDERERSWRSQGWTGYQAGPTTATATAAAATDREGGTIEVVEERLRIGKRQVLGGRVRVRSYVTEIPVEEQVSLRTERVRVERRPVDGPLTAVDPGMFRDRTIELEERSEEAVVSKEARLKEEVVVGKTAEERTETVRDTVRRTEVEVEDGRTVRGGSTVAAAAGATVAREDTITLGGRRR